LAYLKLQGILTSKASAADLRRYKESQQSETLYANSVEKLSDGVKTDFNDAFNAKRQELLTSIATGGIDILPVSDVPVDMRRENEPDSDQHGKNVATDEPETQAPKDDETSSSTYSQDKPMINAPTDTAAVVQLQDSATKNASAAVPPPTPDANTDATPSPSSQHRRSKLDLSGAKRMLFGSLGLKTPKTKQDELKTREKLMKDVKPATEPQVEMETENLDDIAADDSWKNKIDLRAVECCHEGIELSTPPFPFVQRWDPQQQRGYRDNAYHKGKGKKRKRNNSNHYEQSSYEGSQRKLVRYDDYEAPQEESHLFDANASGVTQDEEPLDDSCDQNFRDSQAVDEQLLRETDEAAEDLPSLPEDLTTCRTLTRKATKEGLIIAFKQLEMSAETNWQPNISEYQIAAVDDVRSDGVLEMTPAKRDHPTKQVEYDGTTGKRLYSKFEMPGYDNEDDSGKLEISFDELIDPIILRDVQDESDVDKQVNNQLEGSRAEDAAAAREPGDKNFEGHEFGLDGTANVATEPSEENRKEISELIKDAGWRSSIQSAANGGLTAPEDADHQEKRNEHDDSTLIDAPSPKFNGFSSSPVVNVRSSPPIPEVHDPKQMYASGTEIAESAESVPAQDSSSKSVASDRKSAVEYPSLPQLGDESELLQEEAQHRSDPLFERQLLSQDLISSGMDQTPAQSTRSHTNNSQEINPVMSSPSLRAAAESEDEFPELFSQAWESRMSQEVEIKPEFSQNNSISPPSYRRPKGLSKRGSLQKDSNHSWRPDNDNSVSDEEDDEDGASTPRPSQQKSSLVVDLTLSSDSVEFGQNNDDDDSYKLPNGPGWVKKARASRERSASIKANAGKMKTKSR